MLPKCLVPINGKTLIEWQVKALREQVEINKFVIVIGWLGDEIKKHMKTVKSNKKKYVENKDFHVTSSGYSLIMGLKETTNDVVYVNSDVLFDSYVVGCVIKTKHDNCIGIKKESKFRFGEKAYVEDDIVNYIGKGNICPYNAYAVGPTVLSKKGVKNLISVYQNELSTEERKTIHALPLLGLFAEEYELYSTEIADNRCIEINTNEDWKIANILW